MAEDAQGSEVKNESLMEKIIDKIHGDGSSSSSSSDSEPEKRAPESSTKVKLFRLFGREKPLHAILGGGKPADVLLWRNKKVSSGVLAGATSIWVLFELLEYHFLTLICHILIASLIVLFLWANASTFIYKSSPRIPEIRFSEDSFVEVASALRIEINRAFAMLRDVASGRDLKKFLIAVGGLWILSIAGSWCNLLTLFYTTFVLAHTVPVLYEKYERQVDSFGEKAMIQIKKQYAVLDAKLLSKIPRGPLKSKAT